MRRSTFRVVLSRLQGAGTPLLCLAEMADLVFIALLSIVAHFGIVMSTDFAFSFLSFGFFIVPPYGA